MARRQGSHEFLEIARIAKSMGFTTAQRSSGHMVFVDPTGAVVPCNHNPTGSHNRRNVIAQLRRAQRSSEACGGSTFPENM